MRRKRRSRGIWLPVLGDPTAGELDSTVFRSISQSLIEDATTAVNILPVTYDDPRDDDEQDEASQLSEFVGEEYILNSIVGKCHLGYFAFTSDIATLVPPQIVGVTAGFFVARADGGTPGIDDVPIGATGGNATRRNYSPSSPDTMREPWIWHRSWIFSASPLVQSQTSDLLVRVTDTVPTGRTYAANWPSNNGSYGSVMDGPHIHTKSKRHIRQDERLWFATTAQPLDGPFDEGVTAVVQGFLQIRINGRLVKAHNRSAF